MSIDLRLQSLYNRSCGKQFYNKMPEKTKGLSKSTHCERNSVQNSSKVNQDVAAQDTFKKLQTVEQKETFTKIDLLSI